MSLPLGIYSGLLDTLYAATLDESQWQVFLNHLCQATDSVIAFLLRNDVTAGRRVLASGGSIPPAREGGYTTADPVREAFMRRPRAGVIEVEDFLPHCQLVQSDYYPVMAAFGVGYGTCIVPSISVRRYELISLWRTGDRPRLEPDRIELLHLLFPHIQRALEIHQALGISDERARSANAILDASPTASLLLSATGKVIHRNEAARTLLLEQDGFLEQKGRLVPTRAERRTQYNDLLGKAAGAGAETGGAMVVERTNGKRPLQVLVNRFHPTGPRHATRILVLVTDPDRAAWFPDSVLRQLYGLTSAETEVANGLMTGFPPEAIASLRGVSVGTVRTQIKALLYKTGTRRQTDLVRLLYTLPHQANAN